MSITKTELDKALAVMETWPEDLKQDVLRMEPNEREWFLLMAALFEAQPVEKREDRR